MTTARRVALDALARVRDGAYANLALPGLLARSGLSDRDRRFVTELVYGTTRMQRACDFVVDRFLFRDEVEPAVRDALRLGAYQLAFLGTPAHAAVGATVAEVRGKGRGLVNAVLRKVASAPPPAWPDDATRLSYPDWIVDRLVADLGPERAVAALERMNEAATVHERPDGYVQDPASEAVARFVGVAPGERVADVCAAPGGKATLMAAAAPAVVVAADANHGRTGMVAANASSTGVAATVACVTADGRRGPWRDACFDRVLLDAPCSGLGVLRRRADARWRVQPASVDELAGLQRELLVAAAAAVRPGGTLVYSVCTLTTVEGRANAEWFLDSHPHFEATERPGPPWEPSGPGALLLPQAAATDGMYVLGARRSGR